MAPSFIFGGNTGETPESIKRKRELAMAIMGASRAPRNVGEGLNALGSGIAAGIMNRRADKAERTGRAGADGVFQGIVNRITGQAPDAGASGMVPPDGGNGAGVGVSSRPDDPRVGSTIDFARGGASGSPAVNMSGHDIYTSFMDTVDNTITNPFGLAAVAATGKAESRFSPRNVNRTWSDPSESGQAGTAGGIMSWRGERLANLQTYAASKGEQGNGSPQTQAEFLLREDPNLIMALNNAKSVEEAQRIINRAWKFAGWNRPGGEAAERLATANAILPNFQGKETPQEVINLGPSIRMPPQTATGKVNTGGASAPSVSLSEGVAFEQTPEYRAQFLGMKAPQGIPAQFQGSRQLVNAQGGIMPALMGGTPASPEQVARAQAMGQQQPQAPQGPNQMELLQGLGNPFLSAEQRAVLQALYQQHVQQQESAREQA